VKEHANLETILDLFEQEISKNVKNKHKVYMFEKNKFQNINHILEILKSGNYNGGKYNIFLIKEPKHRIVMALDISDKLINHFIARYVLEVKLSKYLDPRNIATRKNMGTDYGIKLVKKYLELNKKYEKFYILKLDISKYFYSIDHEVLKDLVKDKLTEEEFNFLSIILDSTNRDYINKKIDEIKKRYLEKHPQYKEEMSSIPYYEYGKGLPIGNMTSQFLAVFYLYKLHHYIVNNLKVRDIVVYMDDYVLIHHDREYLKYVRDEIIRILNNEYCLKVNENKTYIRSCKEGISFLGYNIKVVNNKTIFDISKSSRIKIKKNIKRIRYLYENDKISFNRAFTSVNVIKNSFKYGNSIKIKNIIDRYWF